MNSETIVYYVVALLLGMLLSHMLKSVCGCKVVEGQHHHPVETVEHVELRGSEKAPHFSHGHPHHPPLSISR